MGKASFCVKCGRKLMEGENFCTACGTKAVDLEYENNFVDYDRKEEPQEKLNKEPYINEQITSNVENKTKNNSNKLYILIGSIVILVFALLIGYKLFFDRNEKSSPQMESQKLQQEDSEVIESKVVEEIKEKESIDQTDYSAEYEGTWSDLYSYRCWMTIEEITDNRFEIEIHWSGGANETQRWEFIGSYDEVQNGIVYSGDSIYEYYDDEGNAKKEYLYTDGEGLLYIADDGYLYWNDWKENAGAECFFQKD